MHKMKLFALILALGYAASAAMVAADTLTVSAQTTSDTGNMIAKIYLNQEDFDDRKMSTSVTGPAVLGVTTLVFKDLKPGIYGVTLFQDKNDNKELDRNFVGAPKEPFGFSNNPVIRFKAPEFDEIKFEFDGNPKENNITLNGN